MGIVRRKATSKTAENAENSAPETVESAASATEQTAENAASSTNSGSGGGRGPSLIWTLDRDRALLALIAANTVTNDDGSKSCTLTREEAAEKLQAHPLFVADAALVTPQKVGLRAGQLRRPVRSTNKKGKVVKGGGLTALPKFRKTGGGGRSADSWYNPANVADDLAAEFGQFVVASE